MARGGAPPVPPAPVPATPIGGMPVGGAPGSSSSGDEQAAASATHATPARRELLNVISMPFTDELARVPAAAMWRPFLLSAVPCGSAVPLLRHVARNPCGCSQVWLSVQRSAARALTAHRHCYERSQRMLRSLHACSLYEPRRDEMHTASLLHQMPCDPGSIDARGHSREQLSFV